MREEENKEIQQQEFYEKFCMVCVKQLFEDPQAYAELRHGESFIELMLRKIKLKLSQLNSICFICLKPLGCSFRKMRTCGGAMCEFQFEESSLGNIFFEIKKDPEIAHFLVETAYMAFVSGRAADLTEPFPGFLLFNQEFRDKTGQLANIRKAQDKK